MNSSCEINTNMNTTSSLPRSALHLDTFRTEVIKCLDAISNEKNTSKRNEIIMETRVFVNNYANAPPPTPRELPPPNERCTAIRAGGQQCTRRRKENTTFCGTHIRYGQAKCSSNNVFSLSTTQTEDDKPANVGSTRTLHAVVSSSGIPQFVDDGSNIWCAEDVCSEHINPRKIKP